MWFRIGLLGTLMVTAFGATLAISLGAGKRDYSFFDPIIDVERLIAQRFVTEPDVKAMQIAAINGMVESLNDPYTIYVPPQETREFTKELTGDFVGIGVQVVVRDGFLTVVTPLEDTPAFKAGLMAEDKIVEIEGQSTLGKTADECIELLTGQPGTPVKLVVERKGTRVPYTIIRDRIVTKTVKGFHFSGAGSGAGAGSGSGTVSGGAETPATGGGEGWNYYLDPARKIAYLRFTQFTPTSAVEIEETLVGLGAREGKLGGLILDLRWNPGGVLDDAIQIADLFLKEGRIVSTKGRSRPEEVATAQAEGTLPEFPLVLLINGGSASASEVLAGALTENNRAIAVGTRTFGKGSVQGVITLPSGAGQLKLTEQKYYLPSGRSIHRRDSSTTWGVDPTDGYFVPMSDAQIRELLDVRRQEDVIGRGPGTGPGAAGDESRWSDPEWIVSRLKDPQLAAALKAAQGRVDSGSWTPTGQPLPQGAATASQDLERLVQLRERMERELARVDRRIEALEEGGATAAAPTELLPAGVDPTGGRLEVFDKSGKPIATLNVTGADLERWLQQAPLEKAPQP